MKLNEAANVIATRNGRAHTDANESGISSFDGPASRLSAAPMTAGMTTATAAV